MQAVKVLCVSFQSQLYCYRMENLLKILGNLPIEVVIIIASSGALLLLLVGLLLRRHLFGGIAIRLDKKNFEMGETCEVVVVIDAKQGFSVEKVILILQAEQKQLIRSGDYAAKIKWVKVYRDKKTIGKPMDLRASSINEFSFTLQIPESREKMVQPSDPINGKHKIEFETDLPKLRWSLYARAYVSGPDYVTQKRIQITE